MANNGHVAQLRAVPRARVRALPRLRAIAGLRGVREVREVRGVRGVREVRGVRGVREVRGVRGVRGVLGIFGVLLLCNVGLASSQENPLGQPGRPSWDVETVTVQKGDSVTLRCTLSGELGRWPLVRIFKRHAGSTFSIADSSGKLRDPFLSTGRYNVTSQRHDGLVVLVHLTDIRGEDGGWIGCVQYSQRNDKPEALLRLQIKVPVTDVYIEVRERPGLPERRAKTGGVVRMLENVRSSICCVAYVNGSSLAPNLQIVLGDRDATEVFERRERQLRSSTASGLAVHSAEVHLEYSTSAPNVSFNDLPLGCVASHDGYPYKTATVNVDIHFSPRISCSGSTYSAIVGREFELSCDVHANPTTRVEWEWGKHGERLVTPTRTDDIVADKEKTTNDRWLVRLQFSKIRQVHITTYTLTASNDAGVSSVNLRIVSVHSPSYNVRPQTGAMSAGSRAPSCSASPSSLSLALSVAALISGRR